MSIILLAEGADGSDATSENAEGWAERFDLTFPVLADPGWGESNKYEQDFGIPTFHLLGRDLTIRILDGYVSPEAIQEALDEPIPEVPWNEPPSADDLEELDLPVEESGSPLDGSSYESPFGGCAASYAGGVSSGWAAMLGLTALLGMIRRRRET